MLVEVAVGTLVPKGNLSVEHAQHWVKEVEVLGLPRCELVVRLLLPAAVAQIAEVVPAVVVVRMAVV